MADAGPTVRQRELGLRLRNLRLRHEWTVDKVAEELMCSAAKVSRLETGARKPSLRDVRDLCAIYGVSESEASGLMKLAKEAREQGWWTRYEDLNLTPYIGLEQDASAITAYSMYYLHGLVQTEAYAEAIIAGIAPTMDPGVRRERVEARLRRQERLNGESLPAYRLFLDEGVLRRPVGGPAVMGAQLDQVLRLMSEGKVIVQVVPFSVGAYAVFDISFTLFEFSKPMLSPVVYVESLTASQYHERSADIVQYRGAIERIRDCALNPVDSRKWLENIRNIYRDSSVF